MPFSDLRLQRDYQLAWIQNRRSEWIAEHGPCARCGSFDRLEVDHRDRSEKTMHPKALWSLSPKNPKRTAELAKCQVLCHGCHLTKTIAEAKPPVVHGTCSTYYSHRCRCPDCRAAASAQRQREKASPHPLGRGWRKRASLAHLAIGETAMMQFGASL